MCCICLQRLGSNEDWLHDLTHNSWLCWCQQKKARNTHTEATCKFSPTLPWITRDPIRALTPAWFELFGCRHGPVMQQCCCFLAVACRRAGTRESIYCNSSTRIRIWSHGRTNLLETFALILIKQIHNDTTCSQINTNHSHFEKLKEPHFGLMIHLENALCLWPHYVTQLLELNSQG